MIHLFYVSCCVCVPEKVAVFPLPHKMIHCHQSSLFLRSALAFLLHHIHHFLGLEVLREIKVPSLTMLRQYHKEKPRGFREVVEPIPCFGRENHVFCFLGRCMSLQINDHKTSFCFFALFRCFFFRFIFIYTYMAMGQNPVPPVTLKAF